MRRIPIKSRIKGDPNLVRPSVGAGVVNTDEEGYQRALARVRMSDNHRHLAERVDSLETKLDTILSLLKGLQNGSDQ